MSHTTPHPRHARPTRRTSRYLLAFASAAFITGAVALPATAATAPTAPPAVASLLTDTPGAPEDTIEYGDYDAPSDGIIHPGGNGGSDGNKYRDPAGGAYGPDTCLPGYVWREGYDGDTQCVTPEERDVAKASAN